MTDCILLDFDGTITTRDTTRYLLRELLRLRPWRFFSMLPHVVRLLVARDGHEVQKAKNHAISALLTGLTPESLAPALVRYSAAVQPLLRQALVKLIRERAATGNLILVVTASPDFAIRQALAGEPVEVVGTNFRVQDGRYSVGPVGIGCYGLDKPGFIAAWAKKLGAQPRFIEAWSDAESDLPMMMLATRRCWVPPLKMVNRIRQIDPKGQIVEN